jgi:hypothetical protein
MHLHIPRAGTGGQGAKAWGNLAAVLSPLMHSHPSCTLTPYVLSPLMCFHPLCFLTPHVLSPLTYSHPLCTLTPHLFSPLMYSLTPHVLSPLMYFHPLTPHVLSPSPLMYSHPLTPHVLSPSPLMYSHPSCTLTPYALSPLFPNDRHVNVIRRQTVLTLIAQGAPQQSYSKQVVIEAY